MIEHAATHRPGAEDSDPDDAGDELALALVEEATRKSGLVWLTAGDNPPRAAWHVWLDGAAYVVSGGGEQTLPELDDADRVLVTVRSKDKGGRLVTWVARPRTVEPGSEDWPAAVKELAANRLNASESETQTDRWADRSTVTRLEPTGEVRELPGAMPTGSGAAPPRPSPATTRPALPFVIGRATGRGRVAGRRKRA